MLEVTVGKRRSIWREGLTMLWANRRSLPKSQLPLFGLVILVMAAGNFATYTQGATAYREALQSVHAASSQSRDDKLAASTPSPPNNAVSTTSQTRLALFPAIALMFLSLIALVLGEFLIFEWFLLPNEARQDKKRRLKSFLSVLGTVARIALSVFAIVFFLFLIGGLLIGLIILIVWMVARPVHIQSITFIYIALSGVALIMATLDIALVIFAFRLSLSIPLSVLRVQRPMKTSLRLTKGNFWRLFWNTTMLCIILTPIFLFITGAPYVVALFNEADALRVNLVVSLLSAVVWLLLLVVVCTFRVAALNILSDEKQEQFAGYRLQTGGTIAS